MTEILTPAKIESRLYQLSKELDQAHIESVESEKSYFTAKSEYEIAAAKALINLDTGGLKRNADEKNALVVIKVAQQLTALNNADAIVRASRGNMNRLKIQCDIARSLGASVRDSTNL